ncbi:MAG TPA: hemolysin III family protein [Treponemataceae bacterium]|nr:hemolysin III family protein [Treponemataceae bacterium]
MKTTGITKRYSLGEEIASAITHGLGAELSIAALVFLIIKAAASAPAGMKAHYIVAFTIFGASMIVLYLASTLYHALTNPAAKRVFGVFDHSSIYLLIAGTYTAYCLTALRGALGWTLFGIIWGLAATGITFYAIFGARMRKLSAITYIPMALIIILAGSETKARLFATSGSDLSWRLLLAGGAFYIAGTAFYAMKNVKWTHFVWHLFVIAGSAMHFLSIYLIA